MNGEAVQLNDAGRISTSRFGDSIKVEFWKSKIFFLWIERPEMVGTKYWKTKELKGLDVTFTWLND